MKTSKLATVAVSVGALALSSAAATTPQTWWNIDFSEFTASAIADWAGTNNATDLVASDPAGGTFQKTATDDTDLDNSTVFTGVYKEGVEIPSNDPVLKLDTQGKDLVFTPESAKPTVATDVGTVIDADVYFVASETDPSISDSGSKPVQVALYLNADEEGENAVLKAFAYDRTANNGNGGSVWTDLDYDLSGVNVKDGVWLHVQITCNGSDVSYRFGEKGASDAALSEAQTLLRANNDDVNLDPVSEVVFRGTGLVDNFVGSVLNDTSIELTYAAIVADDAAYVGDGYSTGSTVDFTLPVYDDLNETTLVRAKVLAYNSNTGATYTNKNYSVSFDEIEEEISLNDGSTTVTFDVSSSPYFDLTVDVSTWAALYPSEAPDDAIPVLLLYYGDDPDESEGPGDEDEYWDDGNAGDTAAFTAALQEALADEEVPVEFDPADGFTVKFTAPIAGTYSLVAATTVDGVYTDVAGAGASMEADVDDPVELTDASATTANAKFYKIKLTDGIKEDE